MKVQRFTSYSRTIKRALLFALFVLAAFGSCAAQNPVADAFAMPYESYFIAGGCHADGWGTGCALDVNNSINGGALLSSIYGNVVAKGSNDGYGNPYLIIEGIRWKVYYLHGIYDLVSVGDSVVLGQHIGTEASIGRSTGAHTHLSVYDKQTGRWVDPRNILTGNNTLVSGEGLSYDSSPNPQPPGEVSWNTGVVGEFRIEAQTIEQEVIAETTQETPAQENAQNPEELPQVTVEQIDAGDIVHNYFASIAALWWVAVGLILIFLLGNKSSRSWWPVWLLLLLLTILLFAWSRSTRGPPLIARVPLVGEWAQSPPKSEEIVFPAIPEPIATAQVALPPTAISSEEILLSYQPQILKFSSRPPQLSGLDPGTQAWFEWLQAGNLRYETLWYWHDCKLVGIPPESCHRSQYYLAQPPYEAVVAALTVHQLGGAPLWENLTQKIQETGNTGPPFATSSAAAMGPLQEREWFFSNFGAFPNGNVQNYLDAMLAHSNWAVSQGIMAYNTDFETYSYRYRGSPCDPPDMSRCRYDGRYDNAMWNNYPGQGETAWLLSRALMESWLEFQEMYDDNP